MNIVHKVLNNYADGEEDNELWYWTPDISSGNILWNNRWRKMELLERIIMEILKACFACP